MARMALGCLLVVQGKEIFSKLKFKN